VDATAEGGGAEMSKVELGMLCDGRCGEGRIELGMLCVVQQLCSIVVEDRRLQLHGKHPGSTMREKRTSCAERGQNMCKTRQLVTHM